MNDKALHQQASAAPSPNPSPLGRGVIRIAVFFWKWLVAAVLCTSALLSILAVGWVMRLMHRTTLKAWHRRSGATGVRQRFIDFVAADPATYEHRHWPNWMLGQSGRTDGGGFKRTMRLVFGSLWANLRAGLAGIVNVWALTLPPCLIMFFSWYAGWDNSFNKGYEQAYVGPSLGLLGILMFAVALLYVPMAHARQASTGDWRSFYDFGLVWRIIRRRRWACVGFAAAVSLLAVPVSVMKIAPLGFGQSEAWVAMTDAEYLEALRGFYFWCCVVVFAFYTIVGVLSARIYAGGLVALVRSGEVTTDELADREREALHRLGLTDAQPRPRRHLVVRTALGAGGWLTRFGATTAALVLWLVLVIQHLYVPIFFVNHGAPSWLNQPLVMLPWFNYIPAHLLGG